MMLSIDERESLMDYVTQLQSHQLKVTPQRLEIVDILTRYGHVSIEELYAKLQDKFPTLSLATIYKNLKMMQERSFLSEVKLAHQKSVFELQKEEHAHLVCSSCGAIVDISLDASTLISYAQSKSSYTIDYSTINLYGTCAKCQ
jgi:Fur family peroxide stress response transcriptional regulator